MRTRAVTGLGGAAALALLLQAACSSDASTSTAAQGNDAGTQPADAGDAVIADAGGDARVHDGGTAQSLDGGTDAADAAAPLMGSCAISGDGRTNCGAGAESCCTSLLVTGGTYNRTYTNTGGGPTAEADPATLSSFRLDKYEVTVGRFREFVTAWNGGSGWTPPAGSGKHTHLNAGKGLAATSGGYEPGWQIADNVHVAPTNANLSCDAAYQTWAAAPGAHEKLPATCVGFYDSVAFCIWDGGFLPSEAEWEYAAVGGSDERAYEWGTAAPGTNNQYANYGCFYPSGSGTCTGVANISPVGALTAGAGRYGQLDLAGNVSEWTLDSFVTPYTACTDCTNTAVAYDRGARGGFFEGPASYLPPASRFMFNATSGRGRSNGFRCARTP